MQLSWINRKLKGRNLIGDGSIRRQGLGHRHDAAKKLVGILPAPATWSLRAVCVHWFLLKHFEVAPRERVSVHPLLGLRFKKSIGLKYPLDGVRLAPGERTGTSNEAISGPFRIEPEGRQRPWLLVLDRKYLFGIAAAATAMVG